MEIKYTLTNPSTAPTFCEDDITKTVPCQSRIKLGFFDNYNFFVSLILISAIYGFLIWRKKI